ncbi:tRNA 2-selenouridine(34) synthase MnmH [Flavihumibacter petaseus]|uniref:tRNA 2-selenouridine synthase n=1 Tax=Flavihumibacter petaseus NBRC 106054 TaxID=1220578 RepID=A0A0E9MY99_9BACT|nr:tRNA 2-selenouridine(34) synthase MnmH [Flavihumibacter petaseus]GAO42386.1 tRNA 2-selenouridine synthase [Flavihumibacter petaseus NBRC 106054]
MAVVSLDIDTFLEKLAQQPLLLDVRSPAEFAHAHIPGAVSLPLFSDEERKVVGTAYKQESRQQAIKIGLDYFGPKMRPMVETVEKLNAGKEGVLVHCWRGGMRSGGVAWLLDLYGIKVFTLKGGYKAFRQWVLAQFERDYNLQVIGGYTGSGKTEILGKLARHGEAVLDLEALADHRGSAFGHLGRAEQPGQEQFENKLALALHALGAKPFWVEDESLRIGSLFLPNNFHDQLRKAACVFIDIPFEERLDHILKTYGSFPVDQLIVAILRIQKRLGPLETKTAINHLVEKEIRQAFAILLKYYDKFYTKSLNSRPADAKPLNRLNAVAVDTLRNTQLILQACSIP